MNKEKIKEIIIEGARKGLGIIDIIKLLPTDTSMSYYNVRDFIHTNRYEIADYNVDHVILLDLGYKVKSLLISNNLTSIKNLTEMIDTDINSLYYKYDISEKQADRIMRSILNYDENKEMKRISSIKNTSPENKKEEKSDDKKEDNYSVEANIIDSIDLKLRFLQLVSELLEDEIVPKERIAEYGTEIDYKSDDIIYSDSFILLKVNYMKTVLDEYISKNGIILLDYSGFKYLNLVSDLLGDSDIIFTKTINGKKYAYHKFPALTGNYETYIKIYIDKMEMMINKIIKINFDTNTLPPTSSVTPEVEVKTRTRSSIIIDNCNPLSTDKCIARFTESVVIDDSNGNNKFNFHREHNSGIYIFNPEFVSDGELYISSSFRKLTNEELEELKGTVISGLLLLSI